jgi:hypothetical protein
MFTVAAVLAFLKNNWLPIAIGIACLSLMGYIWVIKTERDHYKSQVVELKLQIKKNSEITSQLETSNQELTEKYKNSLKNQFALQSTQGEVAAERIKKDEASKHIAVSPDTISLFNGLKPPAQATPVTKSGDAPEAGTAQKTLNQLLEVSNFNDSNHLKCIATVEMWQEFWLDYTMRYEAITNVAH